MYFLRDKKTKKEFGVLRQDVEDKGELCWMVPEEFNGFPFFNTWLFNKEGDAGLFFVRKKLVAPATVECVEVKDKTRLEIMEEVEEETGVPMILDF